MLNLVFFMLNPITGGTSVPFVFEDTYLGGDKIKLFISSNADAVAILDYSSIAVLFILFSALPLVSIVVSLSAFETAVALDSILSSFVYSSVIISSTFELCTL